MPILRLPDSLSGSSATAATVRRWLKTPGETIRKGDVLVELEVEEALLAIEAPVDGVLAAGGASVGATVPLGAEIGAINPGSVAATPPARVSPATTPSGQSNTQKKATAVSNAGSVTPVLMPQAGNTMEEGRILGWKVNVGDRVAVGQILYEVETDKASVEVESTHAGRLARIVANVGDVVPVKQPVAYLAEADADVDAYLGSAGAQEAAAATPVADTTQTPAPAAGAEGGNKATPILMPQAGNTMEEGTILKWRVKEGDRVTIGQILYEVETDKASVEVEATEAGRIARIVAPEGAVVPVKQPVAFMAESDADVAGIGAGAGGQKPEVGGQKPGASSRKPETRSKPAAPAVTPAAPPATAVGPVSRGGDGRIKASPAARKLAADRGLDLATIGAGSGPEGRILSTDLDRARPAARAAAPAVEKAASAGPLPQANNGQVMRKAMSKMRKAIATNLQTSKQTVPHFYVKLTINADPLFAYYRGRKAETGCTLNDVVLLAVGRTVQEFAAFRSRIEGNEVVELPAANIGVAVSVEDGLVVPVVPNVGGLTLGELVPEAKRIVESARKGKIENMGKGVFTISNMGMLGVEEFSAIINPPESGILAISAVRESVIVKDGAMKAGRVMTMTLSVDHRVVDGALAAQFMASLKTKLESPEATL